MTLRIVQAAGTTGALHLQADTGRLLCNSKARGKYVRRPAVALLAAGNTVAANLCGTCFPPECATPEWVTENVQGDVVNAEAVYVEELSKAVEFNLDVSVMVTADEMAVLDRADDVPEVDTLIEALRDEVLAGCQATARAILERHGARVAVYVQGTKVDA